ncbi:hypothetical protein PV10_04105 [Exophiala mesophila]|uniref:Peptidase S9 prolyl oligopeptidase catalytic domain-containing protein n=1 Tax=Exophiala mesophila TaxID=212818 RepID=A0A0D1XX80_EXOME|nr:uncharacterized protein PV10_04105 [Exophiala mesophila]KIV92841.1 hypothetical protein PV10_04105 [Exophiala mesophila]
MRLSLIVQLTFGWTAACQFFHRTHFEQDVLQSSVVDNRQISFSQTWHTLGPFRIGTREAVWGADPAERYGGIQNISVDDVTKFESPLTRNATVTWERRFFDAHRTEDSSLVELVVDYPHVDWHFSQKIYGWAAFQYQAWVKGEIFNAGISKQKVYLFTDNLLELWINHDHYFGGDYYAFRRAPIVIDLEPGPNTVSARLVGDIRSMGGAYPPILRATLEAFIATESLYLDTSAVLLPDVVQGRFCSPYGSITVRNQADHWICVQSVHQLGPCANEETSVVDDGLCLAPGQSRPLRLRLSLDACGQDFVQFSLKYTTANASTATKSFDVRLQYASIDSVQKVTFLHPSGVVSYAMLRPPSSTSSTPESVLPVMINLHGAGVEADSDQVRASFDDVPNLPTWLLFPTGMSQWSSDDWHTWGFADTQAAVSMVPNWLESVNWTGQGISLDKILVTGHSNGGQGTWYLASHQPDHILAAAAASGYTSIENYVPYEMWSEADPLQTAILQTARSSFRHELLVENLAGLQIFQQHGSADDNVPPYHSRLMNSLLAQSGHHVNYSEMLGKGHWFDGAMTTQPLVEFYEASLRRHDSPKRAPERFTFIVPNSHDLGSRYGIFVDQLVSPDRLGKLEITIEETENMTMWRIRSWNIHRLHILCLPSVINNPDQVIFDGMVFPFDLNETNATNSFVKLESDLWSREVASDWRTPENRYGRQRGALDALLRSNGSFQLVYSCNDTLKLAVQASRNFLQYFGGDSMILPSSRYGEAVEGESNVVLFAKGKSLVSSRIFNFPVDVQDEGLVINTRDSGRLMIPYSKGMGGVWLRPLHGERLELVVWGVDLLGMRHAARLLPTLTGVGQPDFVVFDASATWKGHGGSIAMGFFDRSWQVSGGSYLP